MSQEINTRYDFFSKGIFIDPMVSKSRLQQLVKMIQPKSCSYELIRIGADADGGYLLPNDLEGIEACFSPGVDDIASFEQDLFRKYQIGSHLADFSVDVVPSGTLALSFTKKFLGANTYENFISLEDWVDSFTVFAKDDSLLLQMDIEGGEYETLLSCPTRILSKFRIMVIEFHLIESWAQTNFFGIVEAVFRKLLKTHFVVHNHPNNAMGIVDLNGFYAPRVFELTFIKKTRTSTFEIAKLPHALDFPNVDYMPDIQLPAQWLD
jgi:hypothetical protein